MRVFVDTSALLALLDRHEPRRSAVTEAWNQAFDRGDRLFTSSYVAVETVSLLQRRWGMEAVRVFVEAFLPLMETLFVAAEQHETALAALLAANRRRLSFVDCTSFELMRRRGIASALALDADFAEQGFELLPRSSD